MESVQKQLEELGLSPNEVKVYLASLEIGAATAQQIAAKAAVPRPTTYVALGGLTKRGLVSSHTRGKKQYVQAERPGQLLRMVEEEKRRIAVREIKLKSLIPGLESLISLTGEKLEVKYCEGWDGLEMLQNTLLNSGVNSFDVIRYGTVADAKFNKLPADKSINYGLELKKKGVASRQIIIAKPATLKNWRPFVYNPKVKSKVLPGSATHNSGEVAIFGDYVTVISYLDKPYGCLIKSKDVVQLMRLMFEAVWGSSKARDLRS